MQLTPRKSAKTLIAVRITAPEWRRNPDTGQRELLLGFIDENGNQQHRVTGKELYLHAAGENVEGQIPDGLDRLSNHKFIVHLDHEDQAVGLDIIPARVYRSGVIPASQKGVETVRLNWLLGGAVCQIAQQRPVGVKPDRLVALMRTMEKMAIAGTEIKLGAKIAELGVVAAVGLNTIEVKLNSGRSGGRPVFADTAEDDEDD